MGRGASVGALLLMHAIDVTCCLVLCALRVPCAARALWLLFRPRAKPAQTRQLAAQQSARTGRMPGALKESGFEPLSLSDRARLFGRYTFSRGGQESGAGSGSGTDYGDAEQIAFDVGWGGTLAWSAGTDCARDGLRCPAAVRTPLLCYQEGGLRTVPVLVHTPALRLDGC